MPTLTTEPICKYITYEEATKSQTGVRLNIDNTPDAKALENMQFIGRLIFDRVREHFGRPIGVSSFYRSKDLNAAVGGSLTSQHTTGEAIDIDGDIFGGVTNMEIFKYIKENFTFDQLIHEYGTPSNPAWVHVSLKKYGINRQQVLKIGVKK